MTRPPSVSDRPGSSTGIRRRDLLTAGGIVASGGVVANTVVDVDAFVSAVVGRDSDIDITADSDGILGLVVTESLDQRGVEPLVTVQNNSDTPLRITAGLEDCGVGTLIGPHSTDGCAVTFELAVGGSTTVDIDADLPSGGMVRFSISGQSLDAGFSFSLSRETTAERVRVESRGVTVTRLSQFDRHPGNNHWTIEELVVESDEYELDRIEFEVRERETGAIVGRKTISGVTGTVFEAQQTRGQPGITISPARTESRVRGNITYELVVTGINRIEDSGTKSTTA